MVLATLRLFPKSGLLLHLHFCCQDGEAETYYGNVKDLVFIFTGFSNSKDTIVTYVSHEKSTTHKQDVEGIITLWQTTRDVGKLLSSAEMYKLMLSHYHC